MKNKKINIINLTDVIEGRLRKSIQLEEYEAQLKDLERKKYWLEKEIQMATFIINAVREEISPQEMIKSIISNEMDKLEDN